MKTLFDKINPDVLKKIYDDQSKYPYLVESLIENLKNEVSVGSLTLSDCMTIHSYSSENQFKLTELFDIFGI